MPKKTASSNTGGVPSSVANENHQQIDEEANHVRPSVSIEMATTTETKKNKTSSRNTKRKRKQRDEAVELENKTSSPSAEVRSQENSNNKNNKKKKKKKRKRRDTKNEEQEKNDETNPASNTKQTRKKSKKDDDEEKGGRSATDVDVNSNTSTQAAASTTPRNKKKRKKKKKKTGEITRDTMTTTTTTTRTESGRNHNSNHDHDGDDDNGNSNDDDPSAVVFPYEVNPDDHCESPMTAYADIRPVLDLFVRQHRGTAFQSNHANSKGGAGAGADVCIYDPYYCNGRVADHLEGLGYPNVYNKKEDCYAVWNDPGRYPTYDLFLTNPPYSDDHIERLMAHVTSTHFQQNKTPWLLLMPTFVHKKEYYQRLTAHSGQAPLYVVPHKRYIYAPPRKFRTKTLSATHKKSSPFVTMWYLWGGSKATTEAWYRLLVHNTSPQTKTYEVARSKSALRDLRRKKKI